MNLEIYVLCEIPANSFCISNPQDVQKEILMPYNIHCRTPGHVLIGVWAVNCEINTDSP